MRDFCMLCLISLGLFLLGGCDIIINVGGKKCVTDADCGPNRVCDLDLGRCVKLLDGGDDGSDGEDGNSDGGDESCEDACVPAESTQCAGSVIETCQIGESGCLVWVQGTDCAGTSKPYCDDTKEPAKCSSSCVSNCSSLNASRCQGTSIETCTEVEQDCLRWQIGDDCADTEKALCDDTSGSAVCVCDHTCAENESHCQDTRIQECVPNEYGCRVFSDGLDCATTALALCDDTSGTASCVCDHLCEPGDSHCNGTRIEACEPNADGCRVFADGEDCADGALALCEDTSGTASCVCDHACDPGASHCDGTRIVTCAPNGDGCRVWTDGQDCVDTEDPVCDDTSGSALCVCADTCSPQSATQCADSVVVTCDTGDSGCLQWLPGDDCEDSGDTCFSGACCSPATCQDLGFECGDHDDQCGGTAVCGDCASGVCNQGLCECEFTRCNGVCCAAGEHCYRGRCDQPACGDFFTTGYAPMPLGSSHFVPVELDGSIFLAGGSQTGGILLDDVQIYDLDADSWRRGPDLPDIVYSYDGAIRQGVLYMVGGAHAAKVSVRDVDTLDLQTMLSGSVADLPTDRMNTGGHARLVGDRLYVAGGAHHACDGCGMDPIADVYSYDFSSDSWSSEPSLGLGVTYQDMVALGEDFFVMGGAYNIGGTATDMVQTWSVGDAAWSQTTDMPSVLQTITAEGLGPYVYVLDAYPGYLVSEVLVFDTRTLQWTSGASVTSHMVDFNHCESVVVDGRIWLFGGNGPSGDSDDVSVYHPKCFGCGDHTINDAEVCDGSDLGGQTCETVGAFVGGVLGCNPTCDGYDTSSCLSEACQASAHITKEASNPVFDQQPKSYFFAPGLGHVLIHQTGHNYQDMQGMAVSEDGITWTDAGDFIHPSDLGMQEILSLAVYYDLSTIPPTYHAWVSATDDTTYHSGTDIYYLTSTNPPNWTNHGLVMSRTEAFENRNMLAKTVVEADGVFYLYYEALEGPDSSINGGSIGLATSSDGVVWQKQGEVIPNGTAAYDAVLTGYPAVSRNDYGFHMFYQAQSGSAFDTYYAWSADGISWTRDLNSVLSVSQAWEGSRFAPIGMHTLHGTNHLFYMGYDPTFLGVGLVTMADLCTCPSGWAGPACDLCADGYHDDAGDCVPDPCYAADHGHQLSWVAQSYGPTGGTYPDRAQAVAAFPSGRVAVAGQFNGTMTLGVGEANEQDIVSEGLLDGFVALFEPDGQLAWARSFGSGAEEDMARSLVATADGSVLVVGHIVNAATFGASEPNETQLVGSSDGGAGVAAKYALDGSLLWARNLGVSSGHSTITDVELLPSDGFLAIGFCKGSAVFGPGEANQTTLPCQWAENDVYLSKHNPDGTLLWAKRLTVGGVFDRGHGVDATSDGSITVCGVFDGTTTFGQGEANQTVLPVAGSQDLFIAKYDADGALMWVRSAGQAGRTFCFHHIVLPDQTLLVSGFFEDSVTFDAGGPNEVTLTTGGGRDGLLAAYSADGDFLWARQFSSSVDDYANRPDPAPDGIGFILPGQIGGETVFGVGEPNQTTLVPIGGAEGFVARYRSDGSLDWVRQVGGAGDDAVVGVSVIDGSGFAAAGVFSQTVTFDAEEGGNTQLVSGDGYDPFVMRLDTQCP